MSEQYLERGYLTLNELKERIEPPSEARLEDKRPVAVPECPQRIPCTPCKEICPVNAIRMDNPNDIPVVNYEKCIGCTLCVQICPGLAFFMVQYKGDKARVTMPHELLPVPKKGEEVILLNRRGEAVGKGKVVLVIPRERSVGDTPVITVEMPRDLAWEVRAVKVVVK
jgi:Fe-S-cluster-containing hydrogenase component 2